MERKVFALRMNRVLCLITVLSILIENRSLSNGEIWLRENMAGVKRNGDLKNPTNLLD